MKLDRKNRGWGFLGLVVGALIFAGSLGVTWQLSADWSRDDIRQEQSANNKSRTANNQLKDVCLSLPVVEQIDCLNNEMTTKQEDQHRDRELSAQETIADWTSVIGSVSRIGLVASLIGMFLLFLTFRQAKRSADAANKTHNAFLDVERATLIPYVQDFTTGSGNNGKRVSVGANNIGQGACVLLSFKYGWFDEIPDPQTMEIGGFTRSDLVPAQEDYKIGFYDSNKAMRHKEYFVGVIHYRTTLNVVCNAYLVIELGHGMAEIITPENWPKDN